VCVCVCVCVCDSWIGQAFDANGERGRAVRTMRALLTHDDRDVRRVAQGYVCVCVCVCVCGCVCGCVSGCVCVCVVVGHCQGCFRCLFMCIGHVCVFVLCYMCVCV